jgi:hypothetical protein
MRNFLLGTALAVLVVTPIAAGAVNRAACNSCATTT